MDKDEIIRMAREAGLAEWHESIQQHGFRFANLNNLERFAALVAAHEREDIAQMFDDAPKLMPYAQNSEGGCLTCGFSAEHAATVIRKG